MHTLLHLAMLAAVIFGLARVVPGVRIKDGWSAAAVALVFSLLNWGVGWLIKAVLIVPTVLTLGLFVMLIPFIVNTVVLWLTDKIVETFELKDGKTLLMAAGAITAANGLFHTVLR